MAALVGRTAAKGGLRAQAARSGLIISSATPRFHGYATSPAAGPVDVESQTSVHSHPGAAQPASKLTSLGSIEASWVSLPAREQERIYNELHELQKKDWKELSLDQKKAAYYISYGPHGPRAPIVPPNTNGKVFIGVIGCIVTAVGVFALARSRSQETPKTMSKEWKDAQTEYAREQKMDPFTGVSRADGKGKTYNK